MPRASSDEIMRLPTMPKHRTIARALARHAIRLGLSVDEHYASTGSIYLQVAAPDGYGLKIRVSDHAPCYQCDYSLDGLEGTLTGAKAFIGRWLEARRAADPTLDEELREHEDEQEALARLRRELRRLVGLYRRTRGEYIPDASGAAWWPMALALEAARDDNAARMQAEIDRIRAALA